MQISETYHLTNWIKSEIESGQIIGKFDALIAVLQANSKRQPNQPAAPFEEQKNEVIQSITGINLSSLTLSQLQILDTLEIAPNIGSDGKRKLKNILSNTLDIAHVISEITMMKDRIAKGVSISNQLGTALTPIIDEEPEIAPERYLTRVIFENDASVGNITELKDWTSKWFDIGRGFAMANGNSPEDIEVVGGSRGSLIIELALLVTAALPLGKAINITLDSMVKYKDFQLKAAEVRRLKQDTPSMEAEFEEDAERWEARAELLKKEVVNEIVNGIEQDFPDYQKSSKTELIKAIKTLVDFISKGGDVDCVIPDEVDDDEASEEFIENMVLLRDRFSQIRELKQTLLIGHEDADEDDEDENQDRGEHA